MKNKGAKLVGALFIAAAVCGGLWKTSERIKCANAKAEEAYEVAMLAIMVSAGGDSSTSALLKSLDELYAKTLDACRWAE